MLDSLPLRANRIQGLLVIELHGDVDCYHAPIIKERLLKVIANGDTDLILNMNAVDYVDSVGLSILTSLHKTLLEQGGTLRVLCNNRTIWRIFEITGLQRAFPIYRDEVGLTASLDAK